MSVNRREFLKQTSLAAGIAAGGGSAMGANRSVSILVDPADRVASSAPVKWAIGQLRAALGAKGVAVRPSAEFGVVFSGALRANVPNEPDSFVLTPAVIDGKPVSQASSGDVRGLVYAALELADRVEHSTDALAALRLTTAATERPANTIRSVTRCFVSDVEDKPWYNDRSMWGPYLSMLAAQRFNRFSLAYGIGYDFTRQIRDCYFHFAYPFLLDVPGFKVRVKGLPDAERDSNFEMLRYISEETAARGLQFQLGLWTHAYEWTDSPHANYTIEGLNAGNHAAYCREALRRILVACPAISGVTLRVHGESGIAEGSYDFWKTLFDGIKSCGRPIEIDMHAKGMDAPMIETAVSTGLPVNISPKFWAEHMGLPYHQSSIRELEMPKKAANSFFAISFGSRNFMRYSYGDLFNEDRRHGVLFRVWPGTQRLLLWGSPEMAAAYSRAFQFCGSKGMELCEPLSFKGRKGGGLPLGRTAYADKSLQPHWDWQKYLYTYRVWGRALYNPENVSEPAERYLKKQFGLAAESMDSALSSASRILPLITSAHSPSAANNNYWPEMYYNMSIVDDSKKNPYSDTPAPKRFGRVSPLDPEMFSRIDDFAADLAEGRPSPKYSPIEVAQWLEMSADQADNHLARAVSQIGKRGNVEFRRAAIDIAIQSGIGRFFAWKMRSGVLYGIYLKTGDRAALDEALAAYRKAREAWAAFSARAEGVYVRDVTFGYEYQLRGHWIDRLTQIDEDIAAMAKLAGASTADIRAARVYPSRPNWPCSHQPPPNFRPGHPLEISLTLKDTAAKLSSALLHYRHVNQAELYAVSEMQFRDGVYGATIPAAYTESPYPLQYYFELRDASAGATLYPPLSPSLSNQPYFVVRRGAGPRPAASRLVSTPVPESTP
jgi:hypothetical protein